MMRDGEVEEVRCNVVLVGAAGKSRFAVGLNSPNTTGISTMIYHPTIIKDLGRMVLTMHPVEVGDKPPAGELHVGFKRAVVGAQAYGLVCEHNNTLDDAGDNNDSTFYKQYHRLWDIWHPLILKWFADYRESVGTHAVADASQIKPFLFVVEIDSRDTSFDASPQVISEKRKLVDIDIMSRFESADFLHFFIRTKEDREEAWTRIARQIETQRLKPIK